jgi:beta-lactamase regulating signal transducer with metallopeptidase domain
MDWLVQIGVGNALTAAALAVPASLVGWFGRRPALTHALWLLVLIKLLTPPLYPLHVDWFAAVSANRESVSATIPSGETDTFAQHSSDDSIEDVQPILATSIAPVGEDRGTIESTQPTPMSSAELTNESASVPNIAWQPVALAIWLTGSAAWFGLASLRAWRFHRLLRHARLGDGELLERTQILSTSLGLSRSPRVWLIPGRLSPMLWAFAGRASLILPGELLGRLTSDQRETLLAHELAHLRRRDHWVRVLEFVATGLFWWNPILWWARREIREAEEQCCDAWVVWALPDAVRGYALALVETVDFLSEVRPALPPVASGVGYVHDLRRRMTMIMSGTTHRGLTWGGALLVLGVAAFMLPMLPTFAQTPAPTTRGDSSPEDEVKRAQDALQKAKARLDQARDVEAKKKGELDAVRTPAMRNDACLHCHQNPHGGLKMEGKDGFDDLHNLVIKLSATLEHQRAEIKATEERLKEVMKKLGADSPKKDTGRPDEPRRDPERPKSPDKVPSDNRDPKRPGLERGPGPMIPEVDRRRIDPEDLKAELRKRGDMDAQNEKRIQELTNQMEKLMKELEKMRQEIRGRAPSNSPLERPEIDRRSPDPRPVDDPKRRDEKPRN